MTEIKTLDKKGRVVLGSAFANRLAQIERVTDCEFRIVFVRPVPENEMWLYENEGARDSVFRGLDQAHQHDFVEGPDIEAEVTSLGEFGLDE